MSDKQQEIILAMAKKIDSMTDVLRKLANEKNGTEQFYISLLADDAWKIHEMLQELALGEAPKEKEPSVYETRGLFEW